MDDQSISAISSIEMIKLKRASRRGKLTKLSKRIDDNILLPLHEQSASTLLKLKEDFTKEKHLHEKIQSRYEQLLEREETPTEQMSNELQASEDISDQHEDTLQALEDDYQSLLLVMESRNIERECRTLLEILEPSVGEFESDASKAQASLACFISRITSNGDSTILEIRENFIRLEGEVASQLNKSRLIRKEVKKPSITTPPPVVIRPSGSSSLRLELPEFAGHPLEWHNFYELFRAGDGYSEREKTCFLLRAMKTPEAQQIVKSYSASEEGYQQALKALICRYGAAKKVFPHLVHKMTSPNNITMKDLRCVTISQFAASLALERFDKPLRDEWTKTYKGVEDVPSLEDLQDFLEPLEHNIQSLSIEDKPLSTPHTARQPLSSDSRSNSISSSCPICQDQHRINRCPIFLGYDTTKRNKTARDKRLCFNCLVAGHRSNDCR